MSEDIFASARCEDDGTRWPVEPLAALVGKHRAYTSASMTPKALRAAGGFTYRQADRAAVRCGYHPVEVWPDWYQVPDRISLTFAAIRAELRAAQT